jgi:hypothetical protein
MTGTPAPRPALKKAADAHVHPAAPGHRPVLLRHPDDIPTDAPAATVPEPRVTQEAPKAGERSRRGAAGSSLSGPLAGNTSDSLRRPKGRAGGRRNEATGKKVELTVKIPKTLRKEFKAALKAERKDADTLVTALLRNWLDG